MGKAHKRSEQEMATTNGTANQTAVCRILNTVRFIRITSPKGSHIEVNHVALKEANLALHSNLVSKGYGREFDYSLTYDQMRQLKNLALAPSHAINDRTIRTTEARIASRVVGPITDNGEVDRVRRQKEVVKECTQKLTLLIYDIPTDLDKECPNPSWILWHFGFRLNKSCWVMPEKGLAAKKVQDLFTHWANFPQVETHQIDFGEDQKPKILAIAQRELEKMVMEADTSLKTRIFDAMERYEKAVKALEEAESKGEEVTARQYEHPQRLRDSSIYSSIKSAQEALTAAVDCCRSFDDTLNVEDLCIGLEQAIQAQKASYDALRRIRG